MPRDFNVYLEDILEAIRKIRRYTNGLSRVISQKLSPRGFSKPFHHP
jgi:uncharacterized protein with HEPN domain